MVAACFNVKGFSEAQHRLVRAMTEHCLGIFWFIDLEESESTVITVAVDLWLSLSLI